VTLDFGNDGSTVIPQQTGFVATVAKLLKRLPWSASLVSAAREN
jgi:hypothetical protein